MDKKCARNYDMLLRQLAARPHVAFNIEMLWPTAQGCGMARNELLAAVATFKADELLKNIRHPNVPDVDFGIFHISNKGIKFITTQGGYTKLRRYERYEADNARFTWIRHWAWFFAFVISFFLNLYLLIFEAVP